VETGSPVFAIAVPAAVVGAASFGMASVVQQRATKQVPQLSAINPRLLFVLVKRPAWVLSVVTVVGGLSLQIVALAFGPLLLVQPLLLTSLLFAAVFSAWLSRQPADRILLTGVVCCAAGLSLFLGFARPGGAKDFTIGREGVGLVLLLGGIVLVCLFAAFRLSGEIRALALALATGVLYGITAAMMKAVAGQIRFGGIAEPFQHWPLYVVCLIGPAGFLLSQNAFQGGAFLSPALSIVTVTDPLVSVAAGVTWFGEHVATTPGALAGEVLGALVLVMGVVVLARRSERLRREEEQTGRRTTGG